jgi:hypothetical protein
MKTHSKSSSVLAAVMATILALPGGVWADGGGYGNGWNKGGYKGNQHYNNQYYGHYQGKSGYYSHNYPGHYAYYPSYPCNNCGNHNHNNHNHDNQNLWIGLLGGGILGYALGNYQHSNGAEPAYYPPAATAPPPTASGYQTTYPGNNPCLQQREYQTKIMVGGKQVQGYGTACLQPDGSWRYGEAQPETF